MFKLKSLLAVFLMSIYCINVAAIDNAQLTVEELRIEKARQLMPDVVNRFRSNIGAFKTQVSQATNFSVLSELVLTHGQALWKTAILSYANLNDFDDRALYWARLQTSQALRQAPVFKTLPSIQQEKLLWQLELLTRGQQDIKFDKKASIKILVTGFDPFFLDRHLDQSNPSGVVAMALDDLHMSSNGRVVEIESLIVPVRFADFDQGMIEELLTPYIRDKQVDMIITVSMGRDHFDLERFPGLRRSAEAPDNLNVLTGASAEKPLIPFLNKRPLKGPEFIEFSLPAALMVKAPGDFNINDNHKVTTTKRAFRPHGLQELSQSVSVQGSGGGYLSNEVSYRSLVLRDRYNPKLLVGHVHTPRFNGFKPEKTQQIIKQIKSIISLAADGL